jgi:AraC family transcriptional regulator
MREMTRTGPVTTPAIVELPEQSAAVVDIDGDVGELPALLSEAFCLTEAAINASGAQVAGPPFARYLGLGERIRAEIGFPFQGTLRPTDRVHRVVLPGGRTITTRHVGPYEELGAAWERGMAFAREHGLTPSGPGWECYMTGPDEPGAPVTEVFWPVD